MAEPVCFLCGRPARWDDPLDRHHIFGGPFRRKSERLGLVVPLHHHSCHLYGPGAVHNNRESMLLVKRWGQRQLLAQGWTMEQFIREFGKNYLKYDEEENE